MNCQLGPGLGYGLECNLTSWKQLLDCLDRQWWQILPLGGVVRSAPAAVRQLDLGFCGVGCPHLGIECLDAQLSKLLIHYGCSSNTGLYTQTSMAYLILEMGVSLQPLQQLYKEYSDWATHSWLKTLWEKLDLIHIQAEFHDSNNSTHSNNNNNTNNSNNNSNNNNNYYYSSSNNNTRNRNNVNNNNNNKNNNTNTATITNSSKNTTTNSNNNNNNNNSGNTTTTTTTTNSNNNDDNNNNDKVTTTSPPPQQLLLATTITLTT